MQNPNKILQLFGIPFTALLSVIFGLLVISFPIGIYVVFETDIGDELNYDFPITHLDIFRETNFYQSSFDLSIGDVFVVLWLFYLTLFVISILGPKQNFLKSISSLISVVAYFRASSITEFTVAPYVSSDKGMSRHEWYIEFDEMPIDIEAFEKCLDAHLVKLNTYYNDLISGNILSKLKVKYLITKN